MARFLLFRLLRAVVVMLAVTIVTFVLFYIGPGGNNVARTLAGREASPQVVALIKHRLLLDRSLPVQYGHFLSQLVQGNLGYSYYHGQPVTTIISQAFPITLSLAIGAGILWLVGGVLSGVLSAVKSRSLADRVVTVGALIAYSTPVFVIGLLMLRYISVPLNASGVHFIPGGSYTYFTQSPLGWFEHLILPWIALALITAAAYTRLTRGAMLDVLGEDYIRTARAKGLPERRVIYRHALRAALTPVISQFGIDVATLLGGAVLTESVFGMPGLGYTAVHSIENQDLPVIIGIVIVTSAAVVTANLIVDLLYAVIDPRVRLR